MRKLELLLLTLLVVSWGCKDEETPPPDYFDESEGVYSYEVEKVYYGTQFDNEYYTGDLQVNESNNQIEIVINPGKTNEATFELISLESNEVGYEFEIKPWSGETNGHAWTMKSTIGYYLSGSKTISFILKLEYADDANWDYNYRLIHEATRK